MQLPLHALNEFHKGLDTFPGGLLKRGCDQRIFHGGENRAFAVMAGTEQTFHRHIAQSARGHIRDAQQADVVVRIQKRFQIGDEILDFAPVEKALSANQVIANAGGAQGGFEGAGLLIRAEQDGAILPGDPVG